MWPQAVLSMCRSKYFSFVHIPGDTSHISLKGTGLVLRGSSLLYHPDRKKGCEICYHHHPLGSQMQPRAVKWQDCGPRVRKSGLIWLLMWQQPPPPKATQAPVGLQSQPRQQAEGASGHAMHTLSCQSHSRAALVGHSVGKQESFQGPHIIHSFCKYLLSMCKTSWGHQ